MIDWTALVLASVFILLTVASARAHAHGTKKHKVSGNAGLSRVGGTGPKWEQDVLIPMRDIEQEDDL